LRSILQLLLTVVTAGGVTIDSFSDEVLLEIFKFCVPANGWKSLVHVCRKWRRLVFGEPRRLDVQIVVLGGEPEGFMLDVWPTLPIVVRVYEFTSEMLEELVSALEENDRVCEVYCELVEYGLVEVAEIMQKPYPALTSLHLEAYDASYSDADIIPDSFLGGSAPRLQSLYLNNLAYPALPKLLLSATGLVRLRLKDIPSSGYISPEAMADCLSSVTRLKELQIGFQSSQPHPDLASQRPSPIQRTVLPVLTTLTFKGTNRYLGDLFSHIDAPLLESVDIRFLDPAIFDVSQIAPFINCIETFEAFNQAYMLFDHGLVRVTLSSPTGTTSGKTLVLSIKCGDSVWQLHSLAQSRRPFSPPLAKSERFDVHDNEERCPPLWADGMEYARWVDVFCRFTFVENLYLSEGLAACVAPALEELQVNGERTANVLPALQNLFVEKLKPSGSGQEAIRKFVAAKGLSGHPVSVQGWAKEVTQ
jgi:hypothetical protein